MNYIKQLQAFKNYVAFHELPSVAILLWHTLMMINNMSGWKREFNVPHALIRQYGGLSRQRLSDARKALVEHGLIRYQQGKKGCAPIYEMTVLDSHFLFKQPEQKEQPYSNPDTYADVSPDIYTDNSRTILKHKHKQNRRREEHPIFFYEQHFPEGQKGAWMIIEEWCDIFSEPLVLHAMQVSLLHGGRTLAYIEKILKNWADAGLKTIEEVKKLETLQRKQQQQADQQQVPKENLSLFDELREELVV